MGRRGNRSQSRPPEPTNWETERTLADAEADETIPEGTGASTCPCGSNEFALEAILHVIDGVAKPEPVEVESLTCPECGREFEAIVGENGRYLRGDFLGYVDLDD